VPRWDSWFGLSLFGKTRRVHPALGRRIHRFLVTVVGMPHNTSSRVSSQDPLEFLVACRCPAGPADHPHVNRE
jgi:hypothetical protein